MSTPSVVHPDPATATMPRSARRIVLVLLVLISSLGLLAYGIVWWSEHKYEYVPKRWGVVVPGKIYRSGQLTPEIMEKTLTEHGITTIIDMQLNDLQDENLQAEMRYAKEHGLRHCRFGLGGDGTGEVASYVAAVAMLVECVRDNQPVLVHCAAGTQRTGGVVACYRLLVEGADPRDVMVELKQYDWNPEEDWELREYLNANLPQIAEQLAERGALDRIPAVIPQLAE